MSPKVAVSVGTCSRNHPVVFTTFVKASHSTFLVIFPLLLISVPNVPWIAIRTASASTLLSSRSFSFWVPEVVTLKSIFYRLVLLMTLLQCLLRGWVITSIGKETCGTCGADCFLFLSYGAQLAVIQAAIALFTHTRSLFSSLTQAPYACMDAHSSFWKPDFFFGFNWENNWGLTTSLPLFGSQLSTLSTEICMRVTTTLCSRCCNWSQSSNMAISGKISIFF